MKTLSQHINEAFVNENVTTTSKIYDKFVNHKFINSKLAFNVKDSFDVNVMKNPDKYDKSTISIIEKYAKDSHLIKIDKLLSKVTDYSSRPVKTTRTTLQVMFVKNADDYVEVLKNTKYKSSILDNGDVLIEF